MLMNVLKVLITVTDCGRIVQTLRKVMLVYVKLDLLAMVLTVLVSASYLPKTFSVC